MTCAMCGPTGGGIWPQTRPLCSTHHRKFWWTVLMLREISTWWTITLAPTAKNMQFCSAAHAVPLACGVTLNGTCLKWGTHIDQLAAKIRWTVPKIRCYYELKSYYLGSHLEVTVLLLLFDCIFTIRCFFLVRYEDFTFITVLKSI